MACLLDMVRGEILEYLEKVTLKGEGILTVGSCHELLLDKKKWSLAIMSRGGPLVSMGQGPCVPCPSPGTQRGWRGLAPGTVGFFHNRTCGDIRMGVVELCPWVVPQDLKTECIEQIKL